MRIIDGKKIAEKIIENLKTRPAPKKIFAAVLIGNNKISESFLKQKEKIAKELEVDFRIYRFPDSSAGELKNDDLRKEVGRIALMKKVGGVIVQLPLPENLNAQYILNAIPREKDIDVLGERALGAFYADRNPVLPPAVETIIEILKEPAALFEKSVSEAERAWFPSEARKSEAKSQGASERLGERNPVFSKIKPLAIAVIGAGFLIGKPVSVWLMNQKIKELTIFEKGSDLSELKNYDLIISGVGQAGIIRPEMLKEEAGVIDFGYSTPTARSRANADLMQTDAEISKLVGDFDISQLSNVKSHLSFYTPTPGGTGPILIAKIFENFYKLNS